MQINSNYQYNRGIKNLYANTQNVAFKGFERIIMNGEQYSDELVHNVIAPYLKKKAGEEAIIGFEGGPTMKLTIDIIKEAAKIVKRTPQWFISNIEANNLRIHDDFRAENVPSFNFIYGNADVEAYLKFALKRFHIDKLICKWYDLFPPGCLPKESRSIYAQLKMYESSTNRFHKYLDAHGAINRDINEIKAEMGVIKG